MSLIATAQDISTGWRAWAKGDWTPLARRRLAICKSCEYRKVGLCVLCGCKVEPLVLVPRRSCKVGKW